MSTETYTLREAERELARRRCARDGHQPVDHLATLADLRGFWLCGCRETTWKPTTPTPAAPSRRAEVNGEGRG